MFKSSKAESRLPLRRSHNTAANELKRRNGSRTTLPIASFELRMVSLVLLAATPATAAALLSLWIGSFPPVVTWIATMALTGVWIGSAFLVRGQIRFRMRTLLNALLALKEGDYSLRLKESSARDDFAQMIREVNGLGERLRQQRLSAVEATALLRKVIEEIPVAVFTFDQQHTLRLVNRAGECLLGKASEHVLGSSARDLNLTEFLRDEPARFTRESILGRQGRWDVRRSSFRENGAPHVLLVVHDIRQALREEERQAWQRLIRVMAHELNNSLAPIQSLSTSLLEMLTEQPLPKTWQNDCSNGLSIIATRSEALGRFISGYGKLARLPLPRRQMSDLHELIRRTVALEQRVQIQMEESARLSAFIDPDQIEQVLINLLRNAADAVLTRQQSEPDFLNPRILIRWSADRRTLNITVEDDGTGLANPGNVFVPFFTTKPGGSGIGLALSREIVEAHGGTLSLQNRPDSVGCVAKITLPLQ